MEALLEKERELRLNKDDAGMQVLMLEIVSMCQNDSELITYLKILSRRKAQLRVPLKKTIQSVFLCKRMSIDGDLNLIVTGSEKTPNELTKFLNFYCRSFDLKTFDQVGNSVGNNQEKSFESGNVGEKTIQGSVGTNNSSSTNQNTNSNNSLEGSGYISSLKTHHLLKDLNISNTELKDTKHFQNLCAKEDEKRDNEKALNRIEGFINFSMQLLSEIVEGKFHLEEERVLITIILKDIFEKLKRPVDAMEIIFDVPVETFSSIKENTKIEYQLEILRLCVINFDWTKCELASKKIRKSYFKQNNHKIAETNFYKLMVGVC
ncbi:hypothetical protein EDEG_00399 [Edhazardia aedis USNM 41457]|uniref:PSMD12/CSN4-like N-terminal domain-containing protein n=1 Tax=Edhazardia aedis (strain USNM 41457) TaxID=1003232 RepID=J9DK00_EDHAE|nr:hypothetical protein EDEG_00399 [Edhazardia aedis USNM 41457]|eukprot:EJW01682.1 hypothetical protein EDEG_00399 [Edhazardia aedis USNM 41457]